jgi:hypothetical protein
METTWKFNCNRGIKRIILALAIIATVPGFFFGYLFVSEYYDSKTPSKEDLLSRINAYYKDYDFNLYTGGSIRAMPVEITNEDLEKCRSNLEKHKEYLKKNGDVFDSIASDNLSEEIKTYLNPPSKIKTYTVSIFYVIIGGFIGFGFVWIIATSLFVSLRWIAMGFIDVKK